MNPPARHDSRSAHLFASTLLPSRSYSLTYAVNTSGVPRLTKFYSTLHRSSQTLVHKIFSLVSTRAPGLCNFLDAPELESFLTAQEADGEKLRVVYRNYATLYFVFVVDSAESELGILDLIQVSRSLAGRVTIQARLNDGLGIRGIPG